ncbi:arsenate reductase/protein-tyrosine-phosphatase family protein [Orrella marina]|uniref:arsenate reductase/protein-tyrosine-phosphatase family protein n=1 Tax=Orrella marina TaxID=2163011 RepID=UPI00131F1D04|nr:hypothetical protein [Orrella marina]
MICTANICRSPAAQVLLQKELQDYNVLVESAGTRAVEGNPADSSMIELMLERGYDEILQHRSRALLPSHTNRYQLLLCMERDHLASVQSLNPAVLGRARLFGQWDGQSEVDDPVGRSIATYEKSVDRMTVLAGQWAKKMIEMGFVT